MILRKFAIGNVIFFVNEKQIEEAGGIEQAAIKLKAELFPEKEIELFPEKKTEKPQKQVKEKPEKE